MAQPDPKTEQWFHEFGVTDYELRDIPLDRWDRTLSLQNQARVDQPIDEDLVAQYAMAIDNDAVFPPVIVFEGPNGYVTIDGNHRLESAALADKLTFPAYVLRNLTVPQSLLLTFHANARHGKRTSTSERVQQAAALVAAGVNVTNAATALNINETTLSTYIGANEAERQLAEAGVNTRTLSRGHLSRLSALRNHNVRIAAANWFTEHRINSMDASTIVATIRTLPTEEAQLNYINLEKDRRAALQTATARGRIQLPQPIPNLQRILTELDKIDIDALNGETIRNALPNELRTVLSSRTLDGVAKLRRIATTLG